MGGVGLRTGGRSTAGYHPGRLRRPTQAQRRGEEAGRETILQPRRNGHDVAEGSSPFVAAVASWWFKTPVVAPPPGLQTDGPMRHASGPDFAVVVEWQTQGT